MQLAVLPPATLLGGTAAINQQPIHVVAVLAVTTLAGNTLSSHRLSDTALGPLTLCDVLGK
jgi:hypothetical protein